VPIVVIKNVPVEMSPELAQLFEMLGFPVEEESSGTQMRLGHQQDTDNKQRKLQKDLKKKITK
jgi:hypothetical protein